MTRWNRIARTHAASGRFLFSLTFVGALAACSRVATTDEVAPPRWPDPVLQAGSISAGDQGRATALFTEAQSALDAGDAARARSVAREVVVSYPMAQVSGRALFVMARADLALQAFADADREAGRYAGLLQQGDPRIGEARLVQARAAGGLGDEAGRLRRLLLIAPGAPTNVLLQGADEARDAAGAVDGDTLERSLAEAPANAALRPVVEARYALYLARRGDGEQARLHARAALSGGATGADSVTADQIVRGVPLEDNALPAQTVTLGSVLPTGGSPALSEFSRLISEGVEVAASVATEDGTKADLQSWDDQGDAGEAAAAVEDMERQGFEGAVGFLEEGALDAAAQARRTVMPLVSPTARLASVPGTYTLSGADPAAAAAMARYAARQGFRRVAVIHSRAPESEEEAAAFIAALAQEGIPLAGNLAYDAGATFFAPQIKAVRDSLRKAEIAALHLGPSDTLHAEELEPVAVFLPIPAGDVELVAPQVTFYGLDTLAIRVLGTSGWTDPQTLQAVDQRHTNGVVATAPVDAGPGSPGYARFRAAYENHFRRSLVSPVPALGWDATLILLEAARYGARTPADLQAGMARIRDLQGATGIFSVVDGRVVRRTRVVQIEHGTLIPTG